MGEQIIHLAYGVMIAGIILCFLFSRNHQRDLRKAANEFAFTFVKLSNYISPKPPRAQLQVEALPDGKIRPLPVQQQPEAIRKIFERANAPESVELFAQLDAAAELVSKRASINRTHKAQFQAPVDQLLLMTHTFLVGCENLETIDTPEKKAAFDSFLMEQPQHRMLLIKRITGDMAEDYRTLNKRYASEMERIEAQERQTRKGAKGPEKPVAVKVEEEQTPPVQEQATASAQTASSAQEEDLRDKWHGWGCG